MQVFFASTLVLLALVLNGAHASLLRNLKQATMQASTTTKMHRPFPTGEDSLWETRMCNFLPSGEFKMPDDFGAFHEIYSAEVMLNRKFNKVGFAEAKRGEYLPGLFLIAGTMSINYGSRECRLIAIFEGLRVLGWIPLKETSVYLESLWGELDKTAEELLKIARELPPKERIKKALFNSLNDKIATGWNDKEDGSILTYSQWFNAGYIGDFGYLLFPHPLCMLQNLFLEMYTYGGINRASKGYFRPGKIDKGSVDDEETVFWGKQQSFIKYTGTTLLSSPYLSFVGVELTEQFKMLTENAFSEIALQEKFKDECKLNQNAWVLNEGEPTDFSNENQNKEPADSNTNTLNFPYHAEVLHGESFVEAVTLYINLVNKEPAEGPHKQMTVKDKVYLDYGRGHDSGYFTAAKLNSPDDASVLGGGYDFNPLVSVVDAVKKQAVVDASVPKTEVVASAAEDPLVDTICRELKLIRSEEEEAPSSSISAAVKKKWIQYISQVQ